VRLEAVGKRYGLRQPWIVRDVSLDVSAGRLIRLEGRNGSGKSTLLRVLAGACLPSAGRVTGRPSTGYVPERFPPGLPFSAREFLTHLGRIHGLGRATLAGQVDDCLERLGAAEYAGVPMRALSKGMCQKVAVAQALLPGPGLLVLDEAWTGLDEAARGVLDDAVAQRLAGGAAVVFVDHDQRRLAGLVSERWAVTGGRLVPVAERAGIEAAGEPAVLIEVSGVSGGALGELAGVRSVHVAGERLVLEVEPGASDAVLRRVLADGPVSHVVSVHRGAAAPS
jgi:ABC-2 type transport system ATP-binding protein